MTCCTIDCFYALKSRWGTTHLLLLWIHRRESGKAPRCQRPPEETENVLPGLAAGKGIPARCYPKRMEYRSTCLQVLAQHWVGHCGRSICCVPKYTSNQYTKQAIQLFWKERTVILTDGIVHRLCAWRTERGSWGWGTWAATAWVSRWGSWLSTRPAGACHLCSACRLCWTWAQTTR